jgi:hypothetical protein
LRKHARSETKAALVGAAFAKAATWRTAARLAAGSSVAVYLEHLPGRARAHR